jgi:hemolysin III
LAWLFLALVAGDGPVFVAANVYGATLFTLFVVSATYHRITWAPRPLLLMRRLDHSAIFLLIAGTYTPFCLLLPGRSGDTLLAAVWLGALLGIVRAVFWARAPRPLIAGFYVLLGWFVLPVLPALRAAIGEGGVALLCIGGALYTLGAVIYATKRPDPFPRVFGFHEVFHALVVAAAACHYGVVLAVVAVL